MDSVAPWDVGKLAQCVLQSLEHGPPEFVLRELAAGVAEAGPIDRVAFVLQCESEPCLIGPVSCDATSGVPKRSPFHLPISLVPTHPACFAAPRDGAFEVALRNVGITSFTIVPLLDPRPLGALVLGHPSACVPTEEALRDASALATIGFQIATRFRLNELASGQVPSSSAGSQARAMHAMAMVGRKAALGTIAGGLVHEINNPATFIALASGQIEKLLNQPDRAAGGDTIDLATGIRESTQQIRDLVATFRLLVGVTNRSTVVTVHLQPVLAAAVDLTRAANRHDAVIETQIQTMPPCPGKYVELGSVIINVLENAIESLRTTSVPKKVRVAGSVVDGLIQIQIDDTGEGIAAEVLPRVFEPFFTTRDPNCHAGLGLTVVRETLATFDGRIAIESEVGKGTKVCIEVPVRTV